MDSAESNRSKNNGTLTVNDRGVTHQGTMTDTSPLVKYLPKPPKNQKIKESKVITHLIQDLSLFLESN